MRKVLVLFVPASFSQTQAAAGSSCETFPRVVATFHLSGLTAVLPTTTIFTPAKTGLFRISLYSELTVANGQSGDLVQWDDGLGANGAENSTDLSVDAIKALFSQNGGRI
jgi:hypothetical protein